MPATTLPDLLPYLNMVNGALESGGISSFDSNLLSIVKPNTPEQLYTVKSMDDQFETFLRDPAIIPALVGPGEWLTVDEIPTPLGTHSYCTRARELEII